MRRTRLLAVLASWTLGSVFGFACQSQELEYEEIESADMVYIMNRIQYQGRKAGDDLVLRVLTVDNLPGSAGRSSGEVSQDVYLAISEYDELPEQNLYAIRNVVMPKVEKFALDDGGPVVFISIAMGEHRHIYKVKVTLDNIDIDVMK